MRPADAPFGAEAASVADPTAFIVLPMAVTAVGFFASPPVALERFAFHALICDAL